MHKHFPIEDLDPIGRDLLVKWRWRGSAIGQVLIAVPRAGHRYALGTVFTRLFGSPSHTHETAVDNDHLLLKSFSTADSASIGNRLSLILDISLKDKMHVYAPGAQGYRPIELKITDSPAFTLVPAKYPRAQTLYLTAIRESAPVYQGQFRLFQDIVLIPNTKKLEESVNTANELVVEGSLSSTFHKFDHVFCSQLYHSFTASPEGINLNSHG